MSDKDREAFEKLWAQTYPNDIAYFAQYNDQGVMRDMCRLVGYDLVKAALAHSAEKDAEIERLKAELFDKSFDWRGEADAKAMEEIERLNRVMELLERGMTSDAKKFEAIIMLMADKLEAHGEKFNAAEFDAALAAAQQPICENANLHFNEVKLER